MNERSPCKLRKILKELYVSRFLKNMLYLRKRCYELRMDNVTHVRDHLNKFNKRVTELFKVVYKVEDVYKTISLTSSLPKSYEITVTIPLVEKSTLTFDDSTSLSKIAILKKKKKKTSDVLDGD